MPAIGRSDLHCRLRQLVRHSRGGDGVRFDGLARGEPGDLGFEELDQVPPLGRVGDVHLSCSARRCANLYFVPSSEVL